MDNNAFFGEVTYNKVFSYNGHELVRQLLKKIDNCSIDFSNRFVSNDFGINRRLTDLSTGCKTVLNVLLNPDKIFFGQECGDSAFDNLLLLDGSIYLKWIPFSMSTETGIKYAIHESPSVIKEYTYEEVMDIYGEY